MINSFPHSDVRKRAEDVGRYTQCPGTFPITTVEDTYTPAIIVPDQTITEHVIWDSTVVIDSQTNYALRITGLDGTLVFSVENTFCGSEMAPLNITCPIPAGHLDYISQYTLPSNPNLPKAQTIQFLVKSTLVSPDKTVLSCVEGTSTVAFP